MKGFGEILATGLYVNARRWLDVAQNAQPPNCHTERADRYLGTATFPTIRSIIASTACRCTP
jgi:hypothetical protein